MINVVREGQCLDWKGVSQVPAIVRTVVWRSLGYTTSLALETVSPMVLHV